MMLSEKEKAELNDLLIDIKDGWKFALAKGNQATDITETQNNAIVKLIEDAVK